MDFQEKLHKKTAHRIALSVSITAFLAGCISQPAITSSSLHSPKAAEAPAVQQLPNEVANAMKKDPSFHLLDFDPCSGAEVPTIDGAVIYYYRDASGNCFAGYFDRATSYGKPQENGDNWYCGGPQNGPDVYADEFTGCPGYIGPVDSEPTPPPNFQFTASDFFSPNGDGIEDTSHITVQSAAAVGPWTISIAETGQIVRTGTGPADFQWDGTLDAGTSEETTFFAGAGTLELSAQGQENQDIEFTADGADQVQVAGKISTLIKLVRSLIKRGKITKRIKPKPVPLPGINAKTVAFLSTELEASYVVAKKLRESKVKKFTNTDIFPPKGATINTLEADAVGLTWVNLEYRRIYGHWFEKKNGLKFYRLPKKKSNGRVQANYCVTTVPFEDAPWFNAHLNIQ